MANGQAGMGRDNILPVTRSGRTMGLWSTFALWLAANVVITSIMTGMMFIPDLSIKEAMFAIVAGSVIGAIPLALTGYIGTRTGLSTMVMARASFGQKGAILPALVNTVVLVGWSWIQAYMAGLSLNYAVHYTFGYSNINLFVILAEVLVVAITIYGHRGVEAIEKYISIAMLVLSAVVFYKLFTEYDAGSLITLQLSENPAITSIIAFDIVVATAFSWMSSVCDFNRYCKSEKAGIAGTFAGYLLASLIAMGMGAVVGGFSILGGMEQTYDPTYLLAQHGFGLIASLVVFFSVISTNVMALFSATMSFMNIVPKMNFWIIGMILGVICTIGALFKELLMANFYDFILLIATLFIPVFAIVLTDFFILKKGEYDAEEICSNKKGTYQYQKGINIRAYISYILGAGFAFYFTYVSPLSVGATIPTFIISSGVYWVLMYVSYDVSGRKGHEEIRRDKHAG
ncbi:purine-cytosine permease family protein [Bacillus massiliglaciei]|uniref:purine-cytosine permease family protein n=1 Tax=Bacillus massiliglaciei TaxID=1816693 RepID=UPI000AD35FDC|nr:cytosine permease [Bacillus massiliglaciei]